MKYRPLLMVAILSLSTGFMPDPGRREVVDDAAHSGIHEPGRDATQELVYLELIISDDSGLADDYLLVMPASISVNETGDIILTDELKIKVYDAGGKGKLLFGGRGDGPGEYRTPPTLRVSPSGFITAFDPAGGPRYSVYDTDYNFINTWRFRPSPLLENFLETKGLTSANAKNIMSIAAPDSSSIVYSVDVTAGNSGRFWLLAYEDSSTFVPLFYGANTSYVAAGNRARISTFFGVLVWRLLPGGKIFYLNTAEDRPIDDTTAEYTFHIVSQDGAVDKTFSNTFEPRLITDDYIENYLTRIRGESLEELKEKVGQTLREKKIFNSAGYVVVDHNYVFMFLWGKKDAAGNYIVHVFDADTERFVNKLSWPLGTNVPWSICNGYFCVKVFDADALPVLYKYKLDPSVYGK